MPVLARAVQKLLKLIFIVFLKAGVGFEVDVVISFMTFPFYLYRHNTLKTCLTSTGADLAKRHSILGLYLISSSFIGG